MNERTKQIDHFEADLTLLPASRSGRTKPIHTGYMPNWWLPREGNRELASAGIELIGAVELPPGGSGSVRIYPFAPELWHEVHSGTQLEMTEGPIHTIGTATVTRVVPVLAPVP